MTGDLPAISCDALLGLLYGGKEYGLLPVWRSATPHPRMSGRHWTSKNGGKASGSEGKAIVPSHAGRIHQKEKCAMRKIMLAIRYAMRNLSTMKLTQLLSEAAGKNLRGMKIEDAYRFVKYAVADGAITAIDALNIRTALDAACWLMQTGRLDGMRHITLRDMRGARLAKSLESVLKNSQEPTVEAFAAQWRAAL